MSQTGPEDFAPGLGDRIAKLREQKGLTQKTLAERAGCSITYLSEIESGKNRNISSGKLLRIADELGASLDYLMRGIELPVRERKPIAVPPDLDDVAHEQKWSYAETTAVLETQQLIRARRTSTGTEVPAKYSREDWIELHRNLFGT